jgi:carboxypeptidase Q
MMAQPAASSTIAARFLVSEALVKRFRSILTGSSFRSRISPNYTVMKLRAILPALFALVLPVTAAAQTSITQTYGPAAERLIRAAMVDSAAYRRLGELVDRFGHRLSGSASLEQAIDWIIAEMKKDGLQNVRGEPVLVPRWVRGRESVEMISPRIDTLTMLGLGGSIGTPAQGIEGEVIVVSSFDELTRRAPEAKGKIVLFDVPFTNYGETVQYRSSGAVAAARAGAIASLIRSVSSYSIKNPHTGAMRYDTSVQRIPAAALSVEDAMMVHRMIDRGEKVRLRIKMEAKTLPDAPSRNVMGEVVGREKPDEVVVLGGHIDSWDVGQGAMDDGGGVVAAWEAVRLINKLGLRPRRTIRVVGWTNEENGSRGGTAYRDTHRSQVDKHVLAIESDAGVFKPQGFGFTGSDEAFAVVQEVGKLLAGIGAGQVTRGGGGADIGPIMQLGVPGMSLNVDGTRYFWFHHSEGDTLDKLDPRELLCA